MPSQLHLPRQHDFFGPPWLYVHKLVREQPVEPIRKTASALVLVSSPLGKAVDIPLGRRPAKTAG